MSLQLISTNCGNQVARRAIFSFFRAGDNPISFKTRRCWFDVKSSFKTLCNFESYVGMELSLVPEVESVFVKSDGENGKSYTVFTIINERDPAIRAKVYAREEAIMDAAKGIDFSFRVVSRMNRNLEDMIDNVGILAYKR